MIPTIVRSILASLVVMAAAHPAAAATIWTGPKITFSKPGGANPNQATSQDRITPNVWITRADTMGIYNAAKESSYTDRSPVDTEWAFGTTASLAGLTFRRWVDWHGERPPSTVNVDAVLHLISEDIYIDIKFTEWGGRGNGSFAYERSTPADSQPTPATSYQGLWWASPANSESGWGLNVAHQGDILFATWFTYDVDGSGMWLVMSNGNKVGANAYSGTLFRTSGPPFNSVPFDGSTVGVEQFGTARLEFVDGNNGTFTYTVNGVTRTKAITRQIYSIPVPTCLVGGAAGATPNYQDLWWASPANSESGWGVNITHQGDILFVTWFTYGADRKGQWLVMSNGNRTAPGTYSGALYRTRGPAYNLVPWVGEITAEQVGVGTFTFQSATSGTFAYTVNGVSQSKAITRQVFSAPLTACATP